MDAYIRLVSGKVDIVKNVTEITFVDVQVYDGSVKTDSKKTTHQGRSSAYLPPMRLGIEPAVYSTYINGSTPEVPPTEQAPAYVDNITDPEGDIRPEYVGDVSTDDDFVENVYTNTAIEKTETIVKFTTSPAMGGQSYFYKWASIHGVASDAPPL